MKTDTPWAVINDQLRRENERFERSRLPAHAPLRPQQQERNRPSETPERGVVEIDDYYVI